MDLFFKEKRSCCILISIILVLSTILASTLVVNADDPDRNYYIVHFNKIPTTEEREILSSYMEFHRYLGNEIFVCEIPENNIQLIKTEESIKFMEIIHLITLNKSSFLFKIFLWKLPTFYLEILAR